MDCSKNTQKPLVVDLDGTLLKSDMLWESFFLFVKLMPWYFFQPIVWLFTGGKAYLKTKLAQAVNLSIESLPYDADVLQRLQTAKTKGKSLILATASHEKYANQVSAHLGCFEHVFATNQHVNLSGKHKRDVLVKQFGEKGFDYIGNAMSDLKIWQAADQAILVNPSRQLEKKAYALGNVQEVIKSKTATWKSWIKALRLHQWIKNFLIFVPLVTAHQINSLSMLSHAWIAFGCFGLCASSVYILNDLFDLEDDRHHKTKKFRQFASGTLPIQSGMIWIPILFLAAFTTSVLLLPIAFSITLAIYFLLTLSYSLFLKRIVMLDVVILAALYTSRIIAGLLAVSLKPTYWILVFSLFIFMSLALVKRYAELYQARTNDLKKTRGRGYYSSDFEMIAALGASAGYLSVLVFALYIQDPATAALYRAPQILWLACPLLLFWISRTWLLTHRGLMHDDPVIFAVKDKVSVFTGLLFLIIFWLAI